MGHLVGAISIDDLVLVAQNVRAGADAASVVGFHAVGRVEQRGRGVAACPGSATGSIICLWRPMVAGGVRRAWMDPGVRRLWHHGGRAPAVTAWTDGPQPFEHFRQHPDR